MPRRKPLRSRGTRNQKHPARTQQYKTLTLRQFSGGLCPTIAMQVDFSGFISEPEIPAGRVPSQYENYMKIVGPGNLPFRVLLSGASSLTSSRGWDISRRSADFSSAMAVYKTTFKRAVRKAAHSVLCPTCHVKPGQRCELSPGKPRRDPHRDRRRLAKPTD